jgi:hypothetical protein
LVGLALAGGSARCSSAVPAGDADAVDAAADADGGIDGDTDGGPPVEPRAGRCWTLGVFEDEAPVLEIDLATRSWRDTGARGRGVYAGYNPLGIATFGGRLVVDGFGDTSVVIELATGATEEVLDAPESFRGSFQGIAAVGGELLRIRRANAAELDGFYCWFAGLDDLFVNHAPSRCTRGEMVGTRLAAAGERAYVLADADIAGFSVVDLESGVVERWVDLPLDPPPQGQAVAGGRLILLRGHEPPHVESYDLESGALVDDFALTALTVWTTMGLTCAPE